MTLDGVLYWRRGNVHAVIVANLVKKQVQHLQIVLSTLKKNSRLEKIRKNQIRRNQRTIEAEREMA